MTARDLVTLAVRTVEDFPDMYEIYGEKRFLYKDHTGNTRNRNPILYNFPGGDGLKTGSNNEPGTFGLTASAIRDGRRLVLVIGGLDDRYQISAWKKFSAQIFEVEYKQVAILGELIETNSGRGEPNTFAELG